MIHLLKNLGKPRCEKNNSLPRRKILATPLRGGMLKSTYRAAPVLNPSLAYIYSISEHIIIRIYVYYNTLSV